VFDVVETLEIGATSTVLSEQENEQTRIAYPVIRGATQNHLDDIERAVDMEQCYQGCHRDPRLAAMCEPQQMQCREDTGFPVTRLLDLRTVLDPKYGLERI